MKIYKKLMTCLLTLSLLCSTIPSTSSAEVVEVAETNINLYYAFDSNEQFQSFSSRGFSEDIESITFGWAGLETSEDGTLKLQYETGDFRVPPGYESVLTTTQEKGVKVYLNIFCDGPYDNLLGSLETITVDIRNILNGKTMNGLEFDGVVLDLEGLFVDDQRDFAAFVWFVNNAVKRDGKTVKVALQPGRGTEYSILNKCTDGYILMLHDYEPKYYNLPVNASKPVVTPLAPTYKLLEDLEAELELIGEEKKNDVTLQLNLATAQWKIKNGRIMGPNGTRLPYRPTYTSLVQRMAVIEREDSSGFKRFDDGSPYLHYYDRIDETWNTIWYEDETSFKTKIDAAKILGISSFSVWRMGNLPEIGRYNLDIPDVLNLLE